MIALSAAIRVKLRGRMAPIAASLRNIVPITFGELARVDPMTASVLRAYVFGELPDVDHFVIEVAK